MDAKRYQARERARALARASIARGDATGWFEQLYQQASGELSNVPWADREGHPLLVDWLAEHRALVAGRRALVVGCGLGEDAEELARAGAAVCAFDIAPTAVEWCRRLWPNSSVRYEVGDLLALPREWVGAFDFVLEIYTLQALPAELRAPGMAAMASTLAPGGHLLAISRARELTDPPGELPWPLTRPELEQFAQLGLTQSEFADITTADDPPTRHWRARFTRAS